MRLGIKAKQIVGVTAIVVVAVIALSALNLARVARIVLHESQARAQLLSNAVFHRAREVVVIGDPYVELRRDPGLRAILESSIYGENVTDAAIVDTRGVIIAASDPSLEGRQQAERPNLADLVGPEQGTLTQLRTIYTPEGQTLEVRQPVALGDQAFGTIRVGVSTVLMRQELNGSLQPVLLTAGVALGVAVLVAALLAQLLLRPIHVIKSGLTRLGQGEFGVTLDLPQGDEFGELGTFFNSVSRQLSADRTALAGQKANLQSAVEHLEDSVALFTPSGELLFSNPAMQPKLPADAIGRALRGVLADDHPLRAIVEETLATRQSRGPVQSGDELLMTHAIAGTDGTLVGVLLVARNLTHLARMQSTIAYSRKLVALGRLTAGIAHEVKNPLNAMMIHLELLRTKIRTGGLLAAEAGAGSRADARRGSLGLAEQRSSEAEEGALRHITVIEAEIRRLDEVVQGFLKFSRPEDLRLQPVRVAALFDEMLPVIEPEAEKHHVRVAVDCPAAVPSVNGDAGMLRQAFLNLAMNACQAMPRGGTLRLVCAPAAGDRVEVRFEDTGVGIPPEQLDKIFDLYFTTKDHGTGIGLSMVYRTIQLHDGEVEVQSTPGRGTTFRLLLPRASEI